MPRGKSKFSKARTNMTKTRVKTTLRRAAPVRTLNGIPLKRVVVWSYDTNSPAFKKRIAAELRDIRRKDAERDGIEFIEAVIADQEFQQWWR